MRLAIILWSASGIFGQGTLRQLVSLADAPVTPIDSNSGGGCTGSSGAWTCTGSTTITLTDTTAQFILYSVTGSSLACPATGTLYSTPFTSPSSTFTLTAIGCNGVTRGAILTSVYTIGAASITLVSHTAASSTNNNSVTTTGINTTGATLIILLVSSVGTAPTISDSQSNTWTALTVHTGGSNSQLGYYCYSPSTSASHTFGSSKTSSFPAIAVLAFSGTSGSSVDQQSGNTSAGSGSFQPGSITPTSNNEVVISGLTFNDSTASTLSLTTAGGMIIEDQVHHTGNAIGVASGYVIQTTAVAINPTWNSTHADMFAVSLASFK